MAVICYNGLPGKGKTANATRDAIKAYKSYKIKTFILNCLRKKQNREEIDNIIFSNYPILLDKKTERYSYVLDIRKMHMNYKFPKGSVLILDEAQRYNDSRDFKNFPKKLGIFFQHHRHGDIDKIILVTQHPRRLDNKMRDLCEVFRKFKIWFKLPLLPVVFIYYTDYYEFEDYGKYNHVPRERKIYDYRNGMKLIITWNLFTRFDTKYFKVVFKNLTNIPKKQFKNIAVQEEEMAELGMIY